MARGPALSLDIARLAFPGGPALFDGFHLRVAPGEVVALIGPSGVGKTTLLRLIAGVETGFLGHVLVGGIPAVEAPVPGLVFQDARLLPWLTVMGNLRAVRPGLSDPEIARALGAVGLAGQQDAYPRQLSGGMQRRLGLARALAVNPGLLLLDEPFVSLDRAIVQDLQALLVRLIAETGATGVLVSHDPEDAARLADRAVILAGRPVRVIGELDLTALPRPARGRLAVAKMVERIEALSGRQAGAA